MNANRKPDLVLGLLFFEVCLGCPIPLGLVGAGANSGILWSFLIALGYVLYEAIRIARPLAGLDVGGFGFFAYIIGYVLGELAHSGRFESVLLGAAFTALGGVLGLAAASVSWLVRRRNPSAGSVGVSAAVLHGRPVLPLIVLAVAPLLESLLMTLQMDVVYSISGLLSAGGTAVDWKLLSLDRPILIVLAILSGYALLRRRRWMRLVVTIYVGLGVVFAALHLLLGLRLDSLVAMSVPSGSGYDLANLSMPFYPIALSDYIRACGIELVVRAILCAVIVPWVYLADGRRTS
jgi:hypothetical protein